MTQRSLAGWRVLIGRPAGRSVGLIRLLAEHGASAQAVPLIDIVPPEDSAELDAAVLTLAAGEVDWVAFTSVNAVAAVLERAAALNVAPAIPAGTMVAAVGPATAGALRAAGIAVDLVPETGGSGAALAAVFPTAHRDQTVLLPRSEIAADTVPKVLRDKGYAVAIATAYRTVQRPLPDSVVADLQTGGYRALIVASPSGVGPLAAVRRPDTALVAIGAPTADALRAAGLTCAAVAHSPTDEAIVDALLDLAAVTYAPHDRKDRTST
ncbi:uroporphyrinogen-III synthase [Nakamurella lactea]|uniref:uroporphyrinogen-III synthase n=1 Tax=Nakamurella lactea TaxID=459515 RepID=UPI00040A2E0F|nr:uroporphyrinogen-III synthase [Nakamurella lactea]